ncbi:hypothetical protein DAEQUDRAFT_727984 [Daedalea quercina L-15889]|uniref:RING-type domain-containing protein n=1 Tax=Daedalea quercina L-15889 TaxID=1314783 RepID=A0A165PMW7_9APHY|nr:hypothetical protein DAEQUDRAFT_727984 [Daedalea quercina L-15889]
MSSGLPTLKTPKGMKPRWHCDICNIGFSKKKMQLEHNLKTPHHPCCTICSIGLSNQDRCQKHMTKVHPVLPNQSVPSLSSITPSNISPTAGATATPEIVRAAWGGLSPEATTKLPVPASGTPARLAARMSGALMDAAATSGPAHPTSVTVPQVAATTDAPSLATQWKCMVCDISFTTGSEVTAHYNTSFIHPSCSKCGQGLQDKTELARHFRTVHDADLCVCGVTVNLNDLPAHYQASPSHPKCSRCGGAFRDAAELLEHENAAHAEHCVLCDQWYSTRQLLSQHFYESFIHPHCFECKMGFAGEEEYLAHLNVTHNPSMPFQPVSKGMTESVRILVTPNQTASQLLASTRSPDSVSPSALKRRILPLPSRMKSKDSTESMNAVSSISEGKAVTTRDQENVGPSRPGKESDVTRSVVNIAIQTDPYEEVEEHVSDTYEYIHSGHDSVTSHFTEVDPNSDVLSAISYVSSPVSAVVQVPSALNDGENLASEFDVAGTIEADGPRESPSARYPAAPLSNACTFGRSTRASSSSITDVQSTSASSSCRATSASLSVLDVSNVPSINTQPKSTSAPPKIEEEVVSTISTTTPSATMTTERPVAASASPANTVNQSKPTALSWHCRSCGKDPCEDPTATQCGHIFCRCCIVREIAERLECPVCHKMFLLKLQVLR